MVNGINYLCVKKLTNEQKRIVKIIKIYDSTIKS